MAVVPVCFKLSHNDQAYAIQKIYRQGERGCSCDCPGSQEGINLCRDSTGILIKRKTRSILQFRHGTEMNGLQRMLYPGSYFRSMPQTSSQREHFGVVCYARDCSSNEKQLLLLDSYFGKLSNEDDRSSSDKKESTDQSGQFKSKKGLGSLEDYLGKLNKGR